MLSVQNSLFEAPGWNGLAKKHLSIRHEFKNNANWFRTRLHAWVVFPTCRELWNHCPRDPRFLYTLLLNFENLLKFPFWLIKDEPFNAILWNVLWTGLLIVGQALANWAFSSKDNRCWMAEAGLINGKCMKCSMVGWKFANMMRKWWKRKFTHC